MTVDEVVNLFENHDQYKKFSHIKNPLSTRPDMHAFMLLDQLLPNKHEDIVAASEHDEIYLSIDIEEFAIHATEELITDLIRCGVRYCDEGLCMFT